MHRCSSCFIGAVNGATGFVFHCPQIHAVEEVIPESTLECTHRHTPAGRKVYGFADDSLFQEVWESEIPEAAAASASVGGTGSGSDADAAGPDAPKPSLNRAATWSSTSGEACSVMHRRRAVQQTRGCCVLQRCWERSARNVTQAPNATSSA